MVAAAVQGGGVHAERSKFTNDEGVGPKPRVKFSGIARREVESKFLCSKWVSRPGGCPPNPALICWGWMRFEGNRAFVVCQTTNAPIILGSAAFFLPPPPNLFGPHRYR